MVLYRIGEIIYKNNNNLIFESQGIGYNFIVPDIKRFEVKTKLKFYVYEIKNEYYESSYAFKDFKERLLFIDLISVPGIGPRASFNLLNNGWENTALLIAKGNYEELAKIQYVNNKLAKNIIMELQSKWSKLVDNNKEISKNANNNNNLNEVKETLKMLGFKIAQIDKVIPNLTPNNDVEIMVEEAIRLISNSYDKTANITT
ncbi:Holliday junction DNA helicase RuvA [Mycoplasmopsis meleagridis]|uniref:Holliday junction branch migration complex subunit RuvA n=1 Tax=Mycoplasmopsis meleagridis ATCC 25294 TaxID=1264554 RepID=A0A0F5H1G1_9BACT|nr:Holliday junction branch migration protein RuvA [Mycoplasmopsis meleagridis]KKB27018.1 Holliday junction DNA helicase RuvA [Mycoplasmopsis meleagridis ATCC 25294]KUH47283.1 ATP-dependent DNA helicase RuvA [Mycoplasmopsis meleagridis]OAD18366.1 Holliday junction DNA helicase RuvA [Mycoplasmopsis meleagridis]VEU77495.1 Holliday junction DNA helicase [Mycoplasmopsis meleagridis]